MRAGNTRLPSGIRVRPRSTSTAGSRPSMRLPSKTMVPAHGARSPAMVVTVVVFPAPLRPSSTVVVPASTSKLIPWSTGMAP